MISEIKIYTTYKVKRFFFLMFREILRCPRIVHVNDKVSKEYHQNTFAVLLAKMSKYSTPPPLTHTLIREIQFGNILKIEIQIKNLSSNNVNKTFANNIQTFSFKLLKH